MNYSVMKQTNHKHYRRRREPPAISQLSSINVPCKPCLAERPLGRTGRCPAARRPVLLLSPSLVSPIPLLVLAFLLHLDAHQAQAQLQPQNYLIPGHNMDNLRISELTPVDSIVHQLKAVDRQNENRKFSYHMTGDSFSVDEQSGEVRLVKPLDRERQSQLTVVLSVFDNSDTITRNDLPLESKRRTIIIEDVDDSWPVFNAHKQHSVAGLPNTYQVELNELAPLGSSVISELLVTDADEGQNADILFECRPRLSTNSACDVFALESRRLGSGRYTLSVRTKQLVDFERVQSYKLTLVARGKRPAPLRGVPLEAEATISINLLNVQDEGPVFVNAPYSVSMPEGLKNGTRLLTLVAQDGDAAPQRDLSIIIVPGPFSDHFQVTKDLELAKVWYLETNRTLDRESAPVSELAGNMFTISLVAAELDETGSPVASELELLGALRDATYSRGTLRKENITVLVLDLPDSQPVFVQASTGRPIKDNVLVLNVSESIVSGATLPNLDLAVHDLDQGVNSRFKLALVDAGEGDGSLSSSSRPPASAVFALESEVIYGKAEIVMNVVNASLLDYENPQLRGYKFNLIASKTAQEPGVSEPLVQMLEMQVNIMDANDNSPEFERDQYVIDVPEGAAPGSHVATIRARDSDSGAFGRVNYTLRGLGAARFKLVAGEGKILVNDCMGLGQCLDHELQPSYSLTYEARDGGGRTRNVSVIVNVLDINDNAPRFTELVYKRELISDNLSSKQNYISPQLIVRARDADGPTQGRNNITYRILSSNLTHLDVDPVSGLVYLAQPLDLDRAIAKSQAAMQPPAGESKKIVFEAEVVAEDNGWPVAQNATARILLAVKGNPDGAPHFRQDVYQAYVREDQPVNKSFFQVQALDPDEKDSQLRYSLGYDLNDLININATSGELAFKTRVDFDDYRSANDAPYNITVYATDNSRPYPLRASAVVSILIQDVNDKAPKFEHDDYKVTLVQGQTKPGDVVLQVRALDADKNALLNYSLLLDQLVMQDRNGLQFSLADLESPTASKGYLAHMRRLERMQLVANYRKLFQMNRTTGAIRMDGEPDYAFAASIMVPVRVQDLNQEIFTQSGELQQTQATCTFFLRQHVDRSPVFAPPWTMDKRHYNLSIMEELSVGTPIYSLLAKDPATNERIELFEKLFDSDHKDYFRVDRSTGVVTVNRRIDFEELPASTSSSATKKLELSVKALNAEGMFSIAHLSVQVIDLNDNAPQFKSQNYSVAVSESVAPGHEIVNVVAEDKDSGEFGRVHYSLSGHPSELFTIDARKGSISLKKGFKLDRDTEPSHLLLVTASDCNETLAKLSAASPFDSHVSEPRTGSESISGCKKSSVFVHVTLLDENDNDPTFISVGSNTITNKNRASGFDYEALISETAVVGSVIAQVRALDPDEGLNGKIGYEIVRGGSGDDLSAVSRLVKIDQDGQLSVAESLSGMGRAAPYRIVVRAYDHGKPTSRQSQATLSLTISDVVANDGVPKFIRPKADEVVLLSEQAGPSTFVYQVQAVDSDEKSEEQLMYKLIQASDVFEIDPFTGVIKTLARPNFYLDRELVPNYTLVVIAQDLGTPPKQAHQVLTIKITDANDNEPYFERAIDDPPLVLYVEEEAPRDQLIGTIQAIDKDVGQNAMIGYEIIDGNHNNMFTLSYEPLNAPNNSSHHQQHLLGGEQGGNNPCRIYATTRLDRESRESYLLTIKATSMSKLRNPFIHQLKDPLGSRNPFNQYNASDLTKLRVLIKLLDINDNRPVFSQQNPRSVVDSSAEVYSQLMVFKATDADSSNPEMQYSILDALFYADSRLKSLADGAIAGASTNSLLPFGGPANNQPIEPVSLAHVFDMDPKTGILRNSVPLRPYIDGYFEVFVKADSSGQFINQAAGATGQRDSEEFQLAGTSNKRGLNDPERASSNRCGQDAVSTGDNKQANASQPFAELESCYVAVTKAVVFITHQRETFRFVFNKTKLNDRMDEFKSKMQTALEELMFADHSTATPQASLDGRAGLTDMPVSSSSSARAEKVYLNTFNTDFYEREDGSLDFSTLTSCSQLVKFEDRSASSAVDDSRSLRLDQQQQIVPNQVIDYEQVVSLLKQLNSTQARQHKSSSLFSQYGLVNIERCSPDRTTYKMSTPEKLSLYLAAAIALVSLLLAFIVSRMRKSYEKNLKLLQRSKYQYMSQYPAADMWCNAGF